MGGREADKSGLSGDYVSGDVEVLSRDRVTQEDSVNETSLSRERFTHLDA